MREAASRPLTARLRAKDGSRGGRQKGLYCENLGTECRLMAAGFIGEGDRRRPDSNRGITVLQTVALDRLATPPSAARCLRHRRNRGHCTGKREGLQEKSEPCRRGGWSESRSLRQRDRGDDFPPRRQWEAQETAGLLPGEYGSVHARVVRREPRRTGVAFVLGLSVPLIHLVHVRCGPLQPGGGFILGLLVWRVSRRRRCV